MANVAVVRDDEPVDDYSAARIRHAILEVRTSSNLGWMDGSPVQYPRGIVGNRRGIWQVDIDPTVVKLQPKQNIDKNSVVVYHIEYETRTATRHYP